MDHKAIVWCHHILHFVRNAIITTTDVNNSNNNSSAKLSLKDMMTASTTNTFLSSELSYQEKVMLQDDLLKVSA